MASTVLVASESSRWALITGASSGIGRGIAIDLASRGFNVVLVARRLELLEQLGSLVTEAHGVRTHAIAIDLSVPGSAKQLYDAVLGAGIRIEFLVNCAGFGYRGRLSEQGTDGIERMLRLNVESLTLTSALFVPDMVAAGRGRVMQVSSVAAFQPSPWFSAYAASKAYVMSFGEALSEELAGTGVSCTTVYPGATRTEFNDVAQHRPSKLVLMSEMTGDEVARLAVRATLAGRRSYTVGFMNKVSGLFMRVLPRRAATRIAGKVMSPDAA